MSAMPPAKDVPTRGRPPAGQARGMGELRLRRREAQRKRGLLRLDLAVGVLAAIVLLLITPGVAVAAIVALLVLAGCVGSVFVERRRRRRRLREADGEPAARRNGSGPAVSQKSRRTPSA